MAIFGILFDLLFSSFLPLILQVILGFFGADSSTTL